MEPMLTQDDLKAIGAVVGEQIDAKVPPMIKAGIDELELRIDTKFDAVHELLEDLEGRTNTKFDAIHEDVGIIKGQMVTKSYLDDKLAHYVRAPF